MNRGILLDTCSVIWMTNNEVIKREAAVAIVRAQEIGSPLYVSPVTAWEMAMLLSRGRLRKTRSAKQWYEGFRHDAGVGEMQVTADVFIAACYLPNLRHKDPIDRILIATARMHDLTIITRDQAILTYGAAGHVRVLAC